MRRFAITSATLLALLTLTGPSAARNVSCGSLTTGEPELVCSCTGPNMTNCKCRMIAKDQSGVEVW
jgi:hypothetical protein